MSRETNFDRDLEKTMESIRSSKAQSLEVSMTPITQSFIYIAGSLASIADKLEERPTAEWIDDDEYLSENTKCSSCNFSMLKEFKKICNYCPNCGAKMKESGEEE